MRNRSIRLLVCAVLAGSAPLAALVIPAGVASAVTPQTVSCTTVLATTTGLASLSFSGCTGTGANAINAGKAPSKGTYTFSTDTLKWSNARTSVFAHLFSKSATSTCGVIAADLFIEEVSFTDRVTAGTAKQMIGGAASGKLCVYRTPARQTFVKNLGAFKV